MIGKARKNLIWYIWPTEILMHINTAGFLLSFEISSSSSSIATLVQQQQQLQTQAQQHQHQQPLSSSAKMGVTLSKLRRGLGKFGRWFGGHARAWWTGEGCRRCESPELTWEDLCVAMREVLREEAGDSPSPSPSPSPPPPPSPAASPFSTIKEIIWPDGFPYRRGSYRWTDQCL
ncbi:hypothetical protein HRR79_000642 [Exophiala dermatitidis]|nr:hypothetical protein HRR79_000642 [Exophiala dermatitidis]